MTTKKKKPQFCPYKEYWFGPGDEAQAKPTGCKFKRGLLLKLRDVEYIRPYCTDKTKWAAPSGRKIECSAKLDANTIIMLIDYDSRFEKVRIWNEDNAKNEWVEGICHDFMFLHGEKLHTLSVTLWGQRLPREDQNKMWHKARKPRVLPKPKRKTLRTGFMFDEMSDEAS